MSWNSYIRISARMSIGKFFAASSVLVAVLAVVLTGKGVAAFQESWVRVRSVSRALNFWVCIRQEKR
ncbi:iron permease [Novimethylophilus kurashikiensis]|uniref:Iron permease n=1 Tax=Novimethylophilus kurashikiensis TaxID=1825523 RepID=A0A2R5FBW1_9PROT|nr:hypothetical protein [Novimethylophilus kurashikiensis]GBG15702.1 iron permease [Novimethylophilus kurashikiensis]